MEKLKLIIVDDEPILLRGLVETYDWDNLGYEVAGFADSGEKAIDLIRTIVPHIVLSDIRMKQISGLMVMDQIKKDYPDILFIFISAYRDFEYAQKACELGAFTYLSKPFEEECLIETMKSAYKKCIETRESKQEHENLKKILMGDSNSFLQTIIQRYLKKMVSEDKLTEIILALNLNFNNYMFATICTDIDISYKITNQLDYEAARFNLKEHLLIVLNENFTYWNFENEFGNNIFIIYSNENVIMANLKKVMEQVKKNLKGEIISAISRGYKGIDGLSKSFIEALNLFELASVSGASALTVSEQEMPLTKEESYSINEEFLILSSIRKNDEKLLKDSFIKFIYTFPEDKNSQRMYLHKLILETELLLKDTYGLNDEVKSSFESFYTNFSKINTTALVDVCHKLLCKIIEVRKSLSNEYETQYFIEYMKVAINFIEDNLNDEGLSIVTVAKKIYLNPVYFGRVFKNTYNMTFKQYILKRRMERAISLILDGVVVISDVCEKVGISSPSYFTQLFKQYTGVLPSEYKRKHEG